MREVFEEPIFLFFGAEISPVSQNCLTDSWSYSPEHRKSWNVLESNCRNVVH